MKSYEMNITSKSPLPFPPLLFLNSQFKLSFDLKEYEMIIKMNITEKSPSVVEKEII